MSISRVAAVSVLTGPPLGDFRPKNLGDGGLGETGQLVIPRLGLSRADGGESMEETAATFALPIAVLDRAPVGCT